MSLVDGVVCSVKTVKMQGGGSVPTTVEGEGRWCVGLGPADASY
jgi:hypothetical protein